MKRTFLFAIIASVLSINAYAVSATVTSKDYVDTQDALKQDLIPEAGVNAEENGGGVSVVTYTEDGDGVLGERGIYDGSNGYSRDDADKLVTAAALQSATNHPEKIVTKKVCYQDQNGECILWNLIDTYVYGSCLGVGQSCTTDYDCCTENCSGGVCSTIK